jgi:hypothetical protein
MPRQASRLPPELGDAFSVRAALDAGLTRRRLRHDDLATPIRGLRLVTTEPASETVDGVHRVATESGMLRKELLRRATAYASIAPAHAFYVGATAAVAWDLPLPIRVLRARDRATAKSAAPRNDGMRSSPRRLDVGVFRPHRASKAAGVHGRELRESLTSVRSHAGLRLTSPATTWAFLATELTVDELVVLGDAIVRIPRARGMRRGSPSSALATVEQLEAAMNAGVRHGASRLRAALPLIRVGSASPPETDLRLAIVREGMPEPELDYDVYTAAGDAIGFTELAYPAFRVLVEYEGDHHRTDQAQWDRDIAKHAACLDAGWTPVRITARHLYPSPAPALTAIRRALVRGGWVS